MLASLPVVSMDKIAQGCLSLTDAPLTMPYRQVKQECEMKDKQGQAEKCPQKAKPTCCEGLAQGTRFRCHGGADSIGQRVAGVAAPGGPQRTFQKAK